MVYAASFLLLLIYECALGYTVGFQIKNQITNDSIDSAFISLGHVTPQGVDTSFIFTANNNSISNIPAGGYEISVSAGIGSASFQSIIAKDTIFIVDISFLNSAFTSDTIRKNSSPYFISFQGSNALCNKIIEPGVTIYINSTIDNTSLLQVNMKNAIANGTSLESIKLIGTGNKIALAIDDGGGNSKFNWVVFKGFSNILISQSGWKSVGTDITNSKFDSIGNLRIDGVRLFENNIVTIDNNQSPYFAVPYVELYDSDPNIAIFHNCYFSWFGANINPNFLLKNTYSNIWLFLSNCTVKGVVDVKKMNAFNSIIQKSNFTTGPYEVKNNIFCEQNTGTPPLGVGYNIAVNNNGDSIDFYNNMTTDPKFEGYGTATNSPARHGGISGSDIGFAPDKTSIDSMYKAIIAEYKITNVKKAVLFPIVNSTFNLKVGANLSSLTLYLTKKSKVSIYIFNSSGKFIFQCLNGIYDKGFYVVKNQPYKFGNGVYFIFCKVNEISCVNKIIITK